MKRAWFAAATSLALAGPALAATYGDTLIAMTQMRHPALASIVIDATGKNGPIRVASGKPGKAVATQPLADAMGNSIGTVHFTFRKPSAGATAPEIAAEMARRIYVADNLVEADPFVAGSARAPFAQKLVDRMIDTNPDLVTLAMHVTLAGQSTNIIIASNFGRIGKAGDKDDLHVINDRAVLKEVTDGGRRLAVTLPMYDRAGAVIGALSTSFSMRPGEDPAEAEARAVMVRNALAAATPSLAILTASRWPKL